MSALRVLIVDDSQDTRESLAMLLRLWGHEPLLAWDGPSALQVSSQHRPHVVLLDIGLPGSNGWELGRRLRQQARGELLLVAVTGFGSEADQARSREAGFDLHLTKPADPNQVQRLLAERAALLLSQRDLLAATT